MNHIPPQNGLLIAISIHVTASYKQKLIIMPMHIYKYKKVWPQIATHYENVMN